MNSFFDSNVLLYMLDLKDPRRPLAKSLIASGGFVSVQVLNEFAVVSKRKFKLELPEINESLVIFKDQFEVVPVTLLIHERAMELASVTNIKIYDANIVAAAELSGCNTLYTEDLNDGQRIGSVTIRNPFM